MYKVTDRFTTRDGSWEPTGEPYSITPEMAAKYGDNFPEKGAATHLFAKIVGGPIGHAAFTKGIRFFTRDEAINAYPEAEASGWAHEPLTNSSAYNPDRGETGWWNAQVVGAPSEVAEGLGLPYGWHVSNFVVFEWQDSDVDPGEGPEIPDDREGQVWVIATVNGVVYGGWIPVLETSFYPARES